MHIIKTGFLLLLLPAVAAGAPRHKADKAAPPAPEGMDDFVWLVAPPPVNFVPDPPPVTPELRLEGGKLYKQRCLPCHGEFGDGHGSVGIRLKIPPTDFTKGVFKVRSTLPGRPPSDVDLFRTITRGLHGTPMMPWQQLSPRQRWALVSEVKTFSHRFAEEAPIPALDEAPLPPDENTELRTRGKRLYSLYRCAACHGEHGDANGPAAVMYRNASADRFVRIRDFSRGEFIRGGELADIFLTLRTGFDGTPMGSYGDLPADDIWALAAHVRTLVPDRAAPPAKQPRK